MSIDTKKFKLKSAESNVDALCGVVREKFSVAGEFSLALINEDSSTVPLPRASTGWPAGTIKLQVVKQNVATNAPKPTNATTKSPSSAAAVADASSSVTTNALTTSTSSSRGEYLVFLFLVLLCLFTTQRQNAQNALLSANLPTRPKEILFSSRDDKFTTNKRYEALSVH